ncbi:MAG: YceI family protein [Rhodothermales bacterium]
MTPRIATAFLLLLALALLGAAATAQAQYTVRDASRFWIDGTSTVSAFTCAASEVAGSGSVDEVAMNAARQADLRAEVVIPVRAFDCGVRQMNRDFYEALKGQAYPAVRFALRHAEVLSSAAASEWTPVKVWGTLTLAGAQRPVVVTARGQRLADGRVRIQGRHALRMTDFDIDPPSGLLGLVRAHDDIVVRFDLLASTAGAN